MKVLFVSDGLPAYDRSSYELRYYRLAIGMAKAVDLSICPLDLDYMVEELGENRVEGYEERLREHEITIEKAQLGQVLQKHTYDVIIFVIYQAASENNVRLARRYQPSAVLVIDTVDVQFGRYASYARLTGKEKDWKAAQEIKQKELAAYRRVDYVVVVSEEEGRLISAEDPKIPWGVISNIHPIAERKGIEGRQRDMLYFIGWGEYPPNADAVEYLITDIMPRVRRVVPEARCVVIGKGYPKHLVERAGNGVMFAGHVEDLQPYLNKAYVSVAPLRFGSGVKGKIGEAMAHGIPVVTTPVGAEGFGVQPGKELLVADNAEDFANEVISLLGDEALADRIGEAGWRFMKQSNSLERMEATIREVLEEAATRKPGVRTVLQRRIRASLRDFYDRNIGWRIRSAPDTAPRS